MGLTHFPFLPRLASVVLFALVAAGVVHAADTKRGNEQLDRLGKLSDIASQKMESEVRAALIESLKSSRTDRSKALDVLTKALARVEDDDLLPDKRRAALKTMLKDRIRVTEKEPTNDAVPERPLAKGTRRFDADAKAEQQEELRMSLMEVANLRRDGKFEEANKVAADLAKRYPESTAARAARRTVSAADQAAMLRDLNRQRQARTADALRDIDRSAVLPRGDIEFPKDWKEKTTRRASTLRTVTAKERAILKALDTPIKIDAHDSRFQDVIEYIATLIDQPIVIDKAALEQAQVTYETPVTLRLPKVTARTVLRRILGEFGLTYIIKEEAIQVTSQLRAREMMVARAYYIGDLLTGDLGLLFGFPAVGQFQMAQNAAAIMDLIQTSVDPSSWQLSGGHGAIYYYAPTMSLIIKQSAEVHSMLNSSFAR